MQTHLQSQFLLLIRASLDFIVFFCNSSKSFAWKTTGGGEKKAGHVSQKGKCLFYMKDFRVKMPMHIQNGEELSLLWTVHLKRG